MLTHDQEKIDRQQGQKAGYLPNRLDDTHLAAVEPGHFHRKIVEQRSPTLQPKGRSHRQHHQVPIHGILLYGSIHDPLPEGGRTAGLSIKTFDEPLILFDKLDK
jgi:hypothetical protein